MLDKAQKIAFNVTLYNEYLVYIKCPTAIDAIIVLLVLGSKKVMMFKFK